MASLAQIVKVLEGVYPHIKSFILTSSKSEHVIDTSGGYSIFSTSTANPGFDIRNPHGVTFDLLQIDNKLLVARPGGQCDCAFFYDDNFNLLEFKTNATSVKNVRKNYAKAESQLRNTVKIFRCQGVDLWTLATDVSAHICFSNSYPRKKASEMNRAIRFANDPDTKGIGLYFENSQKI